MKNLILLACATFAASLSGCHSTGRVDVPLSFAKLDTGYINSGLYDLGNVFVWDKKNGVLRDEGHLSVPDSLQQAGPAVALLQASLSKDTRMDVSVDLTKYVADGSLSAEVARTTATQLENVHRLTTDAESLMNYPNAATLGWRRKMANKYPGADYEFFVVDRIVTGNKLTVNSTATQGAGAGANIITVGANVKASVKYESKNAYTQDAGPGKTTTLLIRGTLLRLNGSATDPEFVTVGSQEAKAFNFQRAVETML